MTCIVSGGALNSTHSLTHSIITSRWEGDERTCGSLQFVTGEGAGGVTFSVKTYTPVGLFDYSRAVRHSIFFSVYGTPLTLYGTQLERCIQNLSELTYSSVAEHTQL